MALEQLIVEVPGATQLLEVAEQGPPGPPGPAGGSGAEVAVYTAGPAVSGHQVLAATAGGTVLAASALAGAHLGAVAGISIEAAAAGAPVQVRASGLLAHLGWAWVADQPVYLGEAGALVQVLPAGAVFSQVVGWARAATLLQVALQPPVLLQP